jgi:hypothetical protein
VTHQTGPAALPDTTPPTHTTHSTHKPHLCSKMTSRTEAPMEVPTQDELWNCLACCCFQYNIYTASECMCVRARVRTVTLHVDDQGCVHAVGCGKRHCAGRQSGLNAWAQSELAWACLVHDGHARFVCMSHCMRASDVHDCTNCNVRAALHTSRIYILASRTRIRTRLQTPTHSRRHQWVFIASV